MVLQNIVGWGLQFAWWEKLQVLATWGAGELGLEPRAVQSCLAIFISLCSEVQELGGAENLLGSRGVLGSGGALSAH